MCLRPVIMSIMYRRRAGSLFTWLLSCPLVSVSTFHPLNKSGHSSQSCIYIKKNLVTLRMWPPPFPQLDSGPWCGVRVTREKDVQAPTGATHGAVGKGGLENDKTGCPSSFPLNTDPKSILLPAWDFLQPKFWVNPISCPQDWDVVCQRWQSSPEHGRRGPAFLIRRRSISSSRRRNYH